jgi:hypothetical protein
MGVPSTLISPYTDRYSARVDDLEGRLGGAARRTASRLGRRPPDAPRRAHVWEQYAYRPKEKYDAGKRKDEWLVSATTEAECVREMARCLREIREGSLASVSRPRCPAW